ncbi:polygalacturonase inhibitor-like [Salvia miltiorrhiza]|uniref:polygalacturonase inhibitor-like n=1 Tax=Salvia miltiorrhiza TaxID=226208 RepID=UPI0025ACBF73|nr:polygalacturonase inhibitor-like [Salvia miltiorrhiza]
MMKLSVLTILSLMSILSQPPLSHSIRCNPQDKQVLLKIKQAFNNAYHFASWNPDTDCCYWYIVKCDRKTNRIIDLNVITANISGPIPDAVADLPFLESLTFHKIANLTGTLPRALTKLTHLKSLTISWTNISGPIPSYVSQFKNLTSLDLSFNDLSGPIPASLAQLRGLTGLMLDRNKLTGSIPESFGELPASLQYLDLSHNQLSGSIPKGWGGLNFTTLQLQRNRIEGDASALFGRNKSIQNADLSRNMLEFDLSKVEFPDSLRYLDLNHNRIFGALPAGLAGDTLTFLNVSYNRLCGRIPAGGVLQQMDYSSYFHNKCLCGAPLPDCKSSLQ